MREPLHASWCLLPVTAIVADVSFISLTKALGPALALAAPGAWLICAYQAAVRGGWGTRRQGGHRSRRSGKTSRSGRCDGVVFRAAGLAHFWHHCFADLGRIGQRRISAWGATRWVRRATSISPAWAPKAMGLRTRPLARSLCHMRCLANTCAPMCPASVAGCSTC